MGLPVYISPCFRGDQSEKEKYYPFSLMHASSSHPPVSFKNQPPPPQLTYSNIFLIQLSHAAFSGLLETNSYF